MAASWGGGSGAATANQNTYDPWAIALLGGTPPVGAVAQDRSGSYGDNQAPQWIKDVAGTAYNGSTYEAPQNLGLGSATFGGAPQATPQAAPYTQQSQSNPYLTNYADATAKQAQQNFLQGVMPQIRSGAQAAGQYGGSRQGIAEGVAAGNAAVGLGATNAQAGLQQQSLDNNFYTNNRQLDLSQYNLGANLFNQGITGQTNLGQGDYTSGNAFQNAPMNTLNQYSNIVNPYTGLNGSSTGSNSAGGGLNGAIGGGMTAAMLMKLLGLTG